MKRYETTCVHNVGASSPSSHQIHLRIMIMAGSSMIWVIEFKTTYCTSKQKELYTT